MKVYGFIYLTICLVNGKIYIGQSIHLRDRSYLGSGTALMEAIKKYGKKNFKRRMIKLCFNQKELDAWEYVMIKRYNATDKNIGYNILPGSSNGFGQVNPVKLPGVQDKIKRKKKGKYGGENCYWYGKKLSEETKEKISKKAKERLKKKENNGMFNKRHSKETIEKIREKSAGRTSPRKGAKLSEETKAKLSKSLTEFYKRKSLYEKESCCIIRNRYSST